MSFHQSVYFLKFMMFKKMSLVFLLLAFSLVSIAQDFAPVGAKWHYTYQDFLSSQAGYVLVESLKDTLVLGKNAKKIEQTLYFPNTNPLFLGINLIYSDSNRVYFYQYNKFNLLYDYNANQGDTIFVKEPYYNGGNGDTLIPLLVDSTKIETIGGVQKKVQYVTALEFSWFFGEKFIEGLGSNNYLLPNNAAADPSPGPFRCYEDSVFNYQIVVDCKELVTGIKETQQLFSQYQLQSTVYNEIKLPDIKGTIFIYDSNGNLLANEKIKPTIQVAFLKRGIYVVVLTSNEFQHRYRIIKL
ncbi:MAG: hypothetical protein CVT95_12420 [Bacteroidetes bacterium HGW-Bacteroidetes-12]|nr:MAG: hypothetical protein CVT95_12420 [Bacteroidetes bacterium HGW-Bacteroidetes-12]